MLSLLLDQGQKLTRCIFKGTIDTSGFDYDIINHSICSVFIDQGQNLDVLNYPHFQNMS